MKLLCLISSGLDSPISAYLMLKKGYDVEFIHFDNRPYSDAISIEKTKQIVKQLEKKTKKKLRLHILPHGDTLKKIISKCEKKLTCVLCKYFMLKKAEKLAKDRKCDALLTGDNLAQVASQTLDNIYVISSAIKVPVIRPLIGFNKQEIIDIGKKIDIYDISISPSQACKAVPRYPATHASLETLKKELSKLPLS